MNKQLDINLFKEKACGRSNPSKARSAIISMQRAVAIDSKSSNLYFTLGNRFLDQENYFQTDIAYKKAAAIAPKDPDVYHNWGICFAKQKKYEQATSLFNKALDLNPSDALTWCMLANVLTEQGLYNEAIETYEKGSAMDPNFHDQHANYGKTLYEAGHYEKATEQFEKVLARDPQNLSIRNLLGVCFLTRQCYEEAINCFKTVIDQAEASPFELMNWSMVLWQQGKKEEAMELFKKGKGVIKSFHDPTYVKTDMVELYRSSLIPLERNAKPISDKEEKIGVLRMIKSTKWLLDLLQQDKDQD